MTDKLTLIRRSFARIREALAPEFTGQSEQEISHEQPPPGLCIIRVQLDLDPARPGLRLVKEAKQNLAPNLSSGGPEEVECSVRWFDAYSIDGKVEWIDSQDGDSPYNDDQLVEIIRSWT